MIRWEYKSYLFDPGEQILPKLNQLGNEGWEAFHFSGKSHQGVRVLFKRPIQPTTGEPK